MIIDGKQIALHLKEAMREQVTALAKQYASVISFIEEKKLDKWTHNKTIQKAVESYRITPGQKAYLRSLRLR